MAYSVPQVRTTASTLPMQDDSVTGSSVSFLASGEHVAEGNMSASRLLNGLPLSHPLVAQRVDQTIGGRSLQRRWRIRSRAPTTRKVPEICVETPVLPARLGRPTMTPTLKKVSACDSISGCSLCSGCVSRALLMLSGFLDQRAALQLKWHCPLGLFLHNPGFSPNRPVLESDAAGSVY